MSAAGELGLEVRRLDLLPDAERLFADLYAGSRNAFWLDSNRPGASARFSFMGDASGPLGATISYDVVAGEVRIAHDAPFDALTTPGCG
ncbi:MAG TPA: hypothetical protein VGC49_06425, partial [Solirubrobacterales bacterium]